MNAGRIFGTGPCCSDVFEVVLYAQKPGPIPSVRYVHAPDIETAEMIAMSILSLYRHSHLADKRWDSWSVWIPCTPDRARIPVATSSGRNVCPDVSRRA